MPNRQVGRRAIACLALVLAAGAASAATKVTINSPPGEVLGGGVGTRTYAAPTATITSQVNHGRVIVWAYDGADWISIQLRMPEDLGMQPGNYVNAEHVNRVTGLAPSMEVYGANGDCGDGWGSFKIRQYEESPGTPTTAAKLEATFSWRCNSATAPALTGTILIDAGPRYFSYSRDAGMPIGTASSKSYYGDNSETTFEGQGSYMTIGVSGLRDDWLFYFKPPVGKAFAKGIYAIADGPDETHGSLNWYDNHQSFCPGLSGSLNVRNIAYDTAGNMTAVYATWTLYCDGQPAAFRGTFHHDL